MITLNSENLKSIDWVQRSIILDTETNELQVEFIIVDDLDFDFTFIRKFETEKEAVECAERFISQKLDVSNVKGASVFEITATSIHLENLKAKKLLVEQIFEEQMYLPDNGENFVLDGIDLDSLYEWYEEIVREYESLV